MSESDEVMGHLVVLVQINLSENAPHYILEFYDIIFQVIKAKATFDYPGFLDYIYGNLFSLNFYYFDKF
jgi:hypothetical protein